MSEEQRLEIDLFHESLRKVQAYLKLIGYQIDYQYHYKTIWEHLRKKWWFLVNTLLIATDLCSQLVWLVEGVYTGKTFIELTNLAPCFALCVQSNTYSFFFIKHRQKVFGLIEALHDVQTISAETGKLNEADIKFLKRQMKMFYIAINGLTIIIVVGITLFSIRPIVTIAISYYNNREIELQLPFILLYPFDTNDIRFWPFAYVHQIWSSVMAVLTVLAPYFLCYACSTFIIFQFYLLQNDLENVIPFKYSLDVQLMDDEVKKKLIRIIVRHEKLTECVDLMEFVYTESTLLNVLTSTLLICLTGFNVMAINDLTIALPFLQFLMMGLVQIYLLCYYGDMIMIYSMKVADAAYKCQWYRADKSIVKYLMIISTRARKPCKMTALRYSDINFKTFTKILSSSWSYFALLTSMYRD